MNEDGGERLLRRLGRRRGWAGVCVHGCTCLCVVVCVCMCVDVQCVCVCTCVLAFMSQGNLALVHCAPFSLRTPDWLLGWNPGNAALDVGA